MSVNLREEVPIMLGTVPLQMQPAFSGPVLNTTAGPYNYYSQAEGVPANINPMPGPGFVYPTSWSGDPTAFPQFPSAPRKTFDTSISVKDIGLINITVFKQPCHYQMLMNEVILVEPSCCGLPI